MLVPPLSTCLDNIHYSLVSHRRGWKEEKNRSMTGKQRQFCGITFLGKNQSKISAYTQGPAGSMPISGLLD